MISISIGNSDVVAGIFYRKPDGTIVSTYGIGPEGISWREEDHDKHGCAPYAEVATWVPMRHLRDFPEAQDPMLPYEFDLYWDCHTLGQFLSEYRGDRKVMASARKLAAHYGINLRKPQTVRDYNKNYALNKENP